MLVSVLGRLPAKLGPKTNFRTGSTVAALWMAMIFQKNTDRKSVIFGVWAAPGAPENPGKKLGKKPPTFCKGLRGP